VTLNYSSLLLRSLSIHGTLNTSPKAIPKLDQEAKKKRLPK